MFASWDAEEFSLTSSTEWGEQHARELAEHAVAYLNVDSSASGPDFRASAVPSLNRRHRAKRARRARASRRATGDRRNRLGSGSDYTVFLNFLGVPIADMTFDRTVRRLPLGLRQPPLGAEVRRPGLPAPAAMARVWGVMALRLANADVVPLDYRATARRVREFVKEADRRRERGDSAALRAAERPRSIASRPPRGPLADRVDALLAADAPDRRAAARLDEALIRTERAFLDPAGLPGRPWYRHLAVRAEADLRAGGPARRDRGAGEPRSRPGSQPRSHASSPPSTARQPSSSRTEPRTSAEPTPDYHPTTSDADPCIGAPIATRLSHELT